MNDFKKDEWALILGASSGFGAATAKELAKAGLNICGVHLDRKNRMSEVDALKAEIQKTGVDCRFFNVNAADDEKQNEVLQEMTPMKNKTRIVFHSLAFGTLKNFLSPEAKSRISRSQMDMTVDVMAHSLVYWCQKLYSADYFAPQAFVYAMTSAGSSRVWSSYGAVSAAKSALESHCRQLALELAPKNVCVNALLAGVTDTPALRKIPGNVEMIETAQKRNPSGRLTQPEDIARITVALSQDACSFMTGNVIRVDGGENIVE